MIGLQASILEIERARSFADLSHGEDEDRTYKRLAKIVHPDKLNGIDPKLKARAEKAFRRLTELLRAKNDKTPDVKLGKWKIENPLVSGDVASTYSVSSVEHPSAILKIAHSNANNDLMDAERESLKKLRSGKANPKLARYIPEIFDAFESSAGHRVNVISTAPGLSLTEILSYYPKGLWFRHIVWMMNRILSALIFTHGNSVIHGSIGPDHLIYDPPNHDLVLIDWCYSVPLVAEKLKAIVSKFKGNYPPEVFRKGSDMPAIYDTSDLYMAAKVMKDSAERVPKRFNDIFAWALSASPYSRPDVFKFQERWREAAKAEYGEPKFVQLEIPIN